MSQSSPIGKHMKIFKILSIITTLINLHFLFMTITYYAKKIHNFLISDNIIVTKIHNLAFKNSDHHPVTIQYAIKTTSFLLLP